MRNPRAARLWLPILFALFGVIGCGEAKKVDTIQVSPEAKKADEGAQNGMAEFMKTKSQPKTKTK